jgi:hypothetical protein
LSAGGSSRFFFCATGCWAAVFDAPVAAAAAAAGLLVDGLGGGLDALGGGGGLEGRDDCAYVREADEMEGLAARRAALVNMLMMD